MRGDFAWLGYGFLGPPKAQSPLVSVLGSWGETTRDAVRNEKGWRRRRAPTRYPGTSTSLLGEGEKGWAGLGAAVALHHADGARQRLVEVGAQPIHGQRLEHCQPRRHGLDRGMHGVRGQEDLLPRMLNTGGP